MHTVKLGIYSLLYAVTVAIFASTVLLTPLPLETSAMQLVRDVIIVCASILLLKYTVYMLLCPWYQLATASGRPSRFWQSYEPLVSVIIPAWNEEVGLLSTVKTLLESSYRHVEVVIVNDGSTDGSDRLMRAFITKYERETAWMSHRIALLYHYQPNGGKGSALNRGIALSHGELLLTIDADCTVHEHAIRHFVACFRDPSVMAAVGNVKIGITKTLVGTIQYLEYLFSFYFKKADSIMNTIYIIGGAAGAFRREVFTQVGLYSTRNITEDIELSVRLQKAGMRIVYAHDALIYTEGASDLHGLMKQRLRWKRGRFETFLQHRSLFFSTNRQHNRLLTWVILPLAVFGDMQLTLELVFIVLLYVFSLLTHDFSTFVSGIVVVSLIFAVQMLDDPQHRKWNYLLLAPVGWLLFYLTTIVEVNALLQSVWGMVRKREVRWQKWQRKGLLE